MAIPSNKNLCQQVEKKNKYWRHGEFRDLARDQRHYNWKEWTVLVWDVYGVVGLVEISEG